ncbi:DUF3313 domain-containing protein [Corallincola holothuriorum]|uniref:DUF3313 domain-containing protein n=1 Tax=Corallincola holothuriorum TaxID=2282215 RepID=A0A368NLQ6_9GAMM|nr:DUF3313 domain-containing protein [Corallincola holothuriorum]RCU51532.1 DUF3313 domain-containing protein [Corallincola holothuriorum]
MYNISSSHLVIIVLVSVLSGCIAKPDVAATYSGFLGGGSDYALLKPVTDKDGHVTAMRYRHPSFTLDAYDHIMIEPVKFYLRTDLAKMTSLTDEQKQEIGRLFSKKLIAAVDGRFTLVDKPGPKTLVIKPAISGVALARPDMAGTDYLPIGFVVRSLDEMGQTADQVTVVFFEGEFIDGATGMRVGALVEGHQGRTVARGALLSMDDLKPALTYWANKLKSALYQNSVGKETVEQVN